MNTKRVKDSFWMFVFLVVTVWGFIYLWAMLGG